MLGWSIRTFNLVFCLFSNRLDKRFIVWFLELVPKGFQGDPMESKGIQGDPSGSQFNKPKLWNFLEILKNWLSLGKFSKVHCAWKKISGTKMSQCRKWLRAGNVSGVKCLGYLKLLLYKKAEKERLRRSKNISKPSNFGPDLSQGWTCLGARLVLEPDLSWGRTCPKTSGPEVFCGQKCPKV